MINEIRIGIAEILHMVIFENSFFFLDFWSLIHFTSGFLGMLLIFKFFKQMKDVHKFVLLFAFVVFWEMFELLSIARPIYIFYGALDQIGFAGVGFLKIVSSWVVVPETLIDIIYDLIIGMSAGGLYYLIHKKFKFF